MKKIFSKYKRNITISVAGLALGFGVLSTITTGQCTFVNDGELKTMTLTGNCTTDESIYVPDGYTLYGKNYIIYAKAGDYDGAIIRNAGGLAHVRYLNIELDKSFESCQKLAGIMFENTSGTIMHNSIFDTSKMCNKTDVEIIDDKSDDYVEIAFNSFGGEEDRWIKVVGEIDTIIHNND